MTGSAPGGLKLKCIAITTFSSKNCETFSLLNETESIYSVSQKKVAPPPKTSCYIFT